MQQWDRGLLLTLCDLIKSYGGKYFKYKVRQGPKSVSKEIHKSYSLKHDQAQTRPQEKATLVSSIFPEVCHSSHRSPASNLKLLEILGAL